MSLKNKTVAYFYDQEIGNFSYGTTNPMRPHRVRLTHSLVDSYGLGAKMLVNRPQPSSADDLERFHADGKHFRFGMHHQWACIADERWIAHDPVPSQSMSTF